MELINRMSNLMTTAVIGLSVFCMAEQLEAKHKEVTCLAKNIYHEARGENIEGQIAVANVTMNRVASSYYPDTVCQVVYQRKQFSWTHLKKDHTPHNEELYKEIYNIAEAVYDGNVIDITNGATHYHADYVKPAWRKRLDRVAQYGVHIFYKHKG